MENKLILGDCLTVMSAIDSQSIDMVLADLPYGVTGNKWDSVIPFDKLWEHYERIIKRNGAIVLFGQDKFTARLMLSNEKLHRYNLIWDKILVSGFLNANKMPLRSHEDVCVFNTDVEMVVEQEDICVFYKNLPIYNPQKVKGKKSHSQGNVVRKTNNNYGDYKIVNNSEDFSDMKHPKSIISISKPHPSISLHPTQKPVELMEWLIKTYTNENDLVLDNTMGVGTTCRAAKNIGRRYIGIEKEKKYYDIAVEQLR